MPCLVVQQPCILCASLLWARASCVCVYHTCCQLPPGSPQQCDCSSVCVDALLLLSRRLGSLVLMRILTVACECFGGCVCLPSTKFGQRCVLSVLQRPWSFNTVPFWNVLTTTTNVTGGVQPQTRQYVSQHHPAHSARALSSGTQLRHSAQLCSDKHPLCVPASSHCSCCPHHFVLG